MQKMTSSEGRVEVKSEIETKFYGFCCVCGHRYEAGSHMVVLTAAPNARGKIAHAECVTKQNESVAAAEARKAAAAPRIAARNAEIAKLDAELKEIANRLKGKE
jgi:hypothetical protein